MKQKTKLLVFDCGKPNKGATIKLTDKDGKEMEYLTWSWGNGHLKVEVAV